LPLRLELQLKLLLRELPALLRSSAALLQLPKTFLAGF
jgi:hypothetical protein